MTSIVDPMVVAYIRNNSFEKRKAVVQEILQKYPDRIPVIVGRADLNRAPVIAKCKYLAHRNTTFGKFCVEIRKNIPSLPAQSTLFFFVGNGSLPTNSVLMETLYCQHGNKDGFLYITYTCENAFG